MAPPPIARQRAGGSDDGVMLHAGVHGHRSGNPQPVADSGITGVCVCVCVIVCMTACMCVLACVCVCVCDRMYDCMHVCVGMCDCVCARV